IFSASCLQITNLKRFTRKVFCLFYKDSINVRTAVLYFKIWKFKKEHSCELVKGRIKMKVKKILFVIMVAFLLVLVGCKDKESKDGVSNVDNTDNLTESGMPIVEEEITLKVFARKGSYSGDWNDLMVWNEYEDETNINIEWEQT